MVKFECDKCGKTEKSELKMHIIQVTDSAEIIRYDLCDKCYDEFKKFIRKEVN